MPQSADEQHNKRANNGDKQGYQVIPDAQLAERTTFGVPARAHWLARVMDRDAIPELTADTQFQSLPRLILGGGSNVLFTRDFPGLVLAMENRGIEVQTRRGKHDRIRVSAGENWDQFVRWSLDQGYAGLENLILIPGSVGAAPFQNIGAYGTELEEFVDAVHAWDSEAGEFVWLDREACAFAYRDSIFKRHPGRWIITELDLVLPRSGTPRIHYPGVRDMLDKLGVDKPAPADVALAVETLRRRKLPDPAEIGNAGSFFKNPVVNTSKADELKHDHPELPVFALEGDRAKISAAYLIEYCGFRGTRSGNAGVSERHALVLVNYGGAKGSELWRLAEQIRDTVESEFGIRLEPEPVIL